MVETTPKAAIEKSKGVEEKDGAGTKREMRDLKLLQNLTLPKPNGTSDYSRMDL
jgi:hypothetical protein